MERASLACSRAVVATFASATASSSCVVGPRIVSRNVWATVVASFASAAAVRASSAARLASAVAFFAAEVSDVAASVSAAVAVCATSAACLASAAAFLVAVVSNAEARVASLPLACPLGSPFGVVQELFDFVRGLFTAGLHLFCSLIDCALELAPCLERLFSELLNCLVVASHDILRHKACGCDSSDGVLVLCSDVSSFQLLGGEHCRYLRANGNIGLVRSQRDVEGVWGNGNGLDCVVEGLDNRSAGFS